MSKVKKSGEVTDVRKTAKHRGAARPAKVSRRKARPPLPKAAPGDRGRRKSDGGKRSPTKNSARPPEISYRVRELDPQAKCGRGTSVQQLYRVDERGNGSSRVHLVFFDRHGWYCEHDRDCPAVIHAKRIGSKRRASDGHHNGRTRA